MNFSNFPVQMPAHELYMLLLIFSINNIRNIHILYQISILSIRIIDEEEKTQQASLFGYFHTCLKIPLEVEG